MISHHLIDVCRRNVIGFTNTADFTSSCDLDVIISRQTVDGPRQHCTSKHSNTSTTRHRSERGRHLMQHLYVRTPPQKRSGVARIVVGFHSFTCTPTCSSANGTNHAFAFPAAAGLHFIDPGGVDGWVNLVGWLIPRWFTRLKMVTHLSNN